jgi:hypothetical protein
MFDRIFIKSAGRKSGRKRFSPFTASLLPKEQLLRHQGGLDGIGGLLVISLAGMVVFLMRLALAN